MNYATKLDWKNATGTNTSNFSRKADLAGLKQDFLKLDIDLSRLSIAVKNDAVQKTVYDELVKSVNAIQTVNTSDLV